MGLFKLRHPKIGTNIFKDFLYFTVSEDAGIEPRPIIRLDLIHIFILGHSD
jgi:hypothetical protein